MFALLVVFSAFFAAYGAQTIGTLHDYFLNEPVNSSFIAGLLCQLCSLPQPALGQVSGKRGMTKTREPFFNP